MQIGWWTTGFLTRLGPQGADPARDHARPVPDDADHASRALRDARGAATDYIRFARARGLTDRAIHFRHALRNTLVPVITITGLQIGSLIAFAHHHRDRVPVARHGPAVHPGGEFADIPVMSAYLLLVAFIFVVINLVVDMLYAVVDPRLRIDARAA